jgi:hypothetical protein
VRTVVLLLISNISGGSYAASFGCMGAAVYFAFMF